MIFPQQRKLSSALLVIGIHREELAFGEHVAAGLSTSNLLDVLRIPSGISNTRHFVNHDNEFYYSTEHREIYMQLKQQIDKRYSLLIDLHSGLHDGGTFAEVFSHDNHFIKRMKGAITDSGLESSVRQIKIISSDAVGSDASCDGYPDVPVTKSWVPEEVWNNNKFSYVGLEVYLAGGETGTSKEWVFSRQLIETIIDCKEP